jgi:uncharacterized membrane protein
MKAFKKVYYYMMATLFLFLAIADYSDPQLRGWRRLLIPFLLLAAVCKIVDIARDKE